MPRDTSFDPSRIHVPETERVRKPPLVTPRQVNEMVRGALAARVPSTLHVLGEIGDLSRPRSGHVYFSLKDRESELRCVLWRSSAGKLKFELESGMEVIASGALEVYTPRGTYQLITRKLEPRGVGALELAFRQLRQKLEREGLFDASRKRALPLIPRRIALVTSPRGAAIRDMLETLSKRFPATDVLVHPVSVQGGGAADEIAVAIRDLNRSAGALGGIDVLIVGRGGGSLEDLWAFNEEAVARAIAASEIPVISAVGHEVDVSISDMVADVRAATPTAAAILAVPDARELLDAVERQLLRATRAVSQRIEIARHRLSALCATDAVFRPLGRIRERMQRIDEQQLRADTCLLDRFRDANERLRAVEPALHRFVSGAAFVRISERLRRAHYRAQRALDGALRRAERAVFARLERLNRASPAGRIQRCDEHVRQMRRRLGEGITRRLARHRALLKAKSETLAACDPRRILKRGYSITRDARTRKLLASVERIRDGQRIITELHDGEFRSTADDPKQPRLFE